MREQLSQLRGVRLSRFCDELATPIGAGIETAGRLLVHSPRRYARSLD